jgi:hypothetical protein
MALCSQDEKFSPSSLEHPDPPPPQRSARPVITSKGEVDESQPTFPPSRVHDTVLDWNLNPESFGAGGLLCRLECSHRV